MRSKLLCILIFIVSGFVAYSQAPAWQWAKDASSSGPEQAWDVVYDNFSDNVYCCGSFNGDLSSFYGAGLSSSAGQTDGFVAKYSAIGTVLWAFKIGGTNAEEIKSIATDASGNVYIAGSFSSNNCDFDPSASSFLMSPSGGSGVQDGFVAKYTAAGAFVWAAKFGNNSAEDVWRMYTDASGVYLTGSYTGLVTFNSASPSVVTKNTTGLQGSAEFFGAKYNFSGVVQWVVTGASQKDDSGFDVVSDNSNVYFIGIYEKDMNLYNASGTFASQVTVGSNNNSSIFVASYNAGSGALNWATGAGSSSNNNQYGGGITVDNTALYITGYINGTVSFPVGTPLFTKSSTGNNDMFVAKLYITCNI